ncbi:D-alanyl-D-alanine dipeptidase [Enhygromyxa salina]|uniref:D-alanyl-D-alanine dipeptidase n=2 Tax=Enhygromyxa salina TaxID=215803 RepID=A0A2S9YQU8_9BACT|nr:D-alanyl-D-alanine dipeptidase [Enhygromyxa salina]
MLVVGLLGCEPPNDGPRERADPALAAEPLTDSVAAANSPSDSVVSAKSPRDSVAAAKSSRDSVAAPAVSAPNRPQPAPAQQASPACELVEPPAGLVDLRVEIRSAIVVAGYHRADNFTGAPLPGYEAAGAWLEAEAAEALALAASRLEADGLRLIIYDAYRPRRASQAMVDWCRANAREDLLTDGWVAARSVHGRGRAIDLGLALTDGTVLDMGSRWDQFDPTSFLRGVEGPLLERRLELRAALVRAGFTPYSREWWHFSFEADTPAPVRDRPYACREPG